MEIKPTSATRTRVFVAVLALGVIAGALGLRETSVGTPESPSAESPQKPGVASESVAGSRAAPGISILASGSAAAPVAQKIFVAKPTATQLQTAWTQSAIRMKYLGACAQSHKCIGFDTSEPYSYDLDVSRQNAREIEDFTQVVKVWMETKGVEMPEEAQTIARYFLKTGNDDVKDAAIRLLDLAKPSAANLQSVAGALSSSSSGPLMKVFLKSELVKGCADRSLASICVSLVDRVVRKGSEGMQRVLARHSFSVYNPYTARVLVRFERSESPRSQNRLNLRLNREEAERFQRGG